MPLLCAVFAHIASVACLPPLGSHFMGSALAGSYMRYSLCHRQLQPCDFQDPEQSRLLLIIFSHVRQHSTTPVTFLRMVQHSAQPHVSPRPRPPVGRSERDGWGHTAGAESCNGGGAGRAAGGSRGGSVGVTPSVSHTAPHSEHRLITPAPLVALPAGRLLHVRMCTHPRPEPDTLRPPVFLNVHTPAGRLPRL